MNILKKIDRILGELQVKEEGESGATVVANVEQNPQAATNMVRRQQCPPGQRWCPVKKTCVPDPRVSEGYENQDASLLKRYVELKGNIVEIDYHANADFIWNAVRVPGGNKFDFKKGVIEFDNEEYAKNWYKEFLRLIKRKDFMRDYQQERYRG